MEIEVYRLVIDVLSLAFIVIGAVYAWWNNRTRANQAAISELKDDAHRVENRINLVEKELMHAPGQQEIGEVHYRVDQVGQSVKGIEGTLDQMKNTLSLIQTHLLQDKKS